MYPHERSLVEKLADKPFAIVGINSDQDPIKLQSILKEKDLSWPSFFDGGGTDGPISTRWGVRGWPTIYVLDAKGVIRHKNLRGEKLEAAIEALLAEMEAEDQGANGAR